MDNPPFSQYRTKPIRDIPEINEGDLGDNDQLLLVDNGGANPPPRLLKLILLKKYLDIVDIIKKSSLGAPLGIATLDSNARLNKTQLPIDVVLLSKLNEYVKLAEKGVSNGLATLNVNGIVPNNQLPSDLVRQFELLAHTLSNSNPHNVTALQINAEPAFTILSPSKGGLGKSQITGLLKGTAQGYSAAIGEVDYLSATGILDGGTY